MRKYIFLGLLTLIPTTGLAAGSCKAPQLLQDSSMTPLGIKAWLRTVGSKVKSVRDLVCCLPEEYRSNYMVGHSSVAGQNGTPASPRIIMTNKNGGSPEKPIRMLLSFNGGEAHMQGGKSMEMAYVNPQTKETEYFDLSFDEIEGKHLSNKNPESCMNCHGDNGKAPPGGAKMIFDTFNDWFRFVGGFRFGACNHEEDELRNIVEDQAVESVKSNPQYDCLDKSLLEKDKNVGYRGLANPLASFDNAMNDVAHQQRLKWARSIPQVKSYEYFVGAYYICGGPVTDWMSPEIYRRNFSKLQIDERLKKDGPLEKVFKEALEDENKKVLAFRKKQREIIERKNAGKPVMEVNRSSQACNDTKPLWRDQEKQFKKIAKEDKSKFFANRDPLTLLLLDSYLRSPRLQMGGPSAPARFFLEGEGIGTYMIQKSFRADEIVHGGLPLDKERQPAPLTELMDAYSKNSKTKVDHLCTEVKGLSRASLSAPVGHSRTPPGIK